ncbi:hypothetical protein [Haladaptatus sp. DYSN1]|uniref:DUF7096 domain-containing protein n=1 Tax=unclassified Haladaptatus TaxID=2622732 RepID=UPI00240771DF|nr:hypothetical protein [Haladaptatus sp. DYSN1]
MRTGQNLSLLLVAILVVSGVAPVVALPFESSSTGEHAAQEAAQNDSNVSVTVGAQLSTMMSTTGENLQSSYEDDAFERQVESSDDTKKAKLVANRIQRLERQASQIRARYDRVTAQYEDYELTRNQYAQRLAVLNTRAENCLESLAQAEQRLDQLSDLELSAGGVNKSAIAAARIHLEPITGPGATALKQRFLGANDAQVTLETDNGLSINVDKDESERSRTIKRPRDDDNSIAVNQGEALKSARAVLQGQKLGWTLMNARVNRDRGFYEFRFDYEMNGITGDAAVYVDGSSGNVFAIDEEFSGRNASSNQTNETDELAVIVAEGTPAPDEQVTIQALSNGKAAPGVTISVNGNDVGKTNSNGQVAVSLPSGDVNITGVRGQATGHLEFEFDSAADAPQTGALRGMDATATLDNGTATVTVTYEDEPVRNALVFAEGDRVGRTDKNGVVTFQTDVTDTLLVEVAKGEFGAAFTFVIDGNETIVDRDARRSNVSDILPDDETPQNETQNDSNDNTTETPQQTRTPTPTATQTRTPTQTQTATATETTTSTETTTGTATTTNADTTQYTETTQNTSTTDSSSGETTTQSATENRTPQATSSPGWT